MLDLCLDMNCHSCKENWTHTLSASGSYGRLAGWQADRQAGRQAGRRVGGQAGGWVGRRASRRAGGQANEIWIDFKIPIG